LNGEPLHEKPIRQVLNKLAVKYHIHDEQGHLFHFRLQAFRHAKALELLRQGMPLMRVQQWMASVSPEMTQIYAKMLDDLVRVQWEKTVEHGVVQFKDGQPFSLAGDQLLPGRGSVPFDPEGIREPRQLVKMALGSCLKTATFRCTFGGLPCFHCPAYVLTGEDLPALETYEQQLCEHIERGKQTGNAHWIAVNQQALEERVRPALVLLRQGPRGCNGLSP
jgi:hypothetical protein